MDHHRWNKHWRDASRWGSSKRSHSHVTWGTAVERQSISASSYRYRYLGDCGSQRGFDQQPGRTLLLGLNQIALTFCWNSYQRKEEQLWSFFQFLYNTSFVSALPPPPHLPLLSFADLCDQEPIFCLYSSLLNGWQWHNEIKCLKIFVKEQY